MSSQNVLLTRRAVVQAVMEASYGDAAAVGTSDGVLVSQPQFEIDPNVLKRDFTRDSLSNLPYIIGRKIAKMTFTTELRGNDKENSGLAVDAPIIARLFRACGFALTEVVAPGHLGMYDIGTHLNRVAWAESTSQPGTGTVTIAVGNAADNDTVTIHGKVYTFQTVLTNIDGHVLIGVDATATALNLKNAINNLPSTGQGTTFAAATTTNPDVTAASALGVVTLTSIARGTVANGYGLAVTGANLSVSGATLTGGVNEHSATDVICYWLEVTTPGASGVAQITVTSDTLGENTASAVVTTGTPFTFGTKGLTFTPTFTGNLVAGQRWVVWALRTGIRLDPVSDGFESIHLVMNKDGVLHSMPGTFGTFNIEAEAGQFAKVNWEFQGIYVEPTDSPLTVPDYETSLPHQVELARLRVDDFNAVVAKFTFNMQNDIQIRPDVSSSDGYKGIRIVSRNPEGGIDPEAALVADHDFWGKMGAATRMPFQMRVGTDPGNTVWVFCPVSQYTKMSYADRNGLLTYDIGLGFAGYKTNDEICIFLT